jgi:hypothetical protein
MKKKEDKSYIVVYLHETDGDIMVERKTGEEIRTFIKGRCQGFQEGITIIDGNLIKSENNKIDLSKL